MKAIVGGSLMALVLGAGAAWAHSDVTCTVPKAEWRPSVDLQKKLKKEGWAVRLIKVENGCYEVYGFDEKDARVEAWFNPKTFEMVGRATN
jgi:hypothetical protein